MNIYLTLIPLAIMFSNAQGMSMSKSCSTVNGKTVCEEQQGSGNVAGASSSAMSGRGGSYQGAGAMTGNTNTGASSSSFSQAGQPLPGFGPGAFAPGFGPGGFDPTAFIPRFPFAGGFAGAYAFGRR